MLAGRIAFVAIVALVSAGPSSTFVDGVAEPVVPAAVVPAAGEPAAVGPASPDDEFARPPVELPTARLSPSACPAPPTSPWKPLFFDNDFSAYVDKEPYVLGEELKQIPLDLPGEELDFVFSAGGQLRHRYMSESDRIRPNGPGESAYHLWRWRQYFDLRNDYLRVYVETIAADSHGEDLPPVPIDVNRFDLLNAFVDLHLYESDDYGAGTLRYGRQELLYGKQRLLSPLDWSNTRRNFQGFKFFHQGDGWKFDAFAVNPVNPVARGVDFGRFDSQPDEADHRRTLWGGYLSLTGEPKLSADLYMLYQDDERARPDFAEGDRGLNGVRLYGVLPAGGDRAWDYDLEGGYQWGSDLGRRVAAGFATGEVGHAWKEAAWKPRIAALAYYGSGGDRDNQTFYTYYPLGHAYWGILDNLAGQNLIDVSPRISIDPTKKLNVTGEYHYFRKVDGDGFLYNVAQVPVGPVGSGRHIGHETDLVATWTFNPNLNVQAGYAHFWYGDAGQAASRSDTAEFFYMQTTFNY